MPLAQERKLLPLLFGVWLLGGCAASSPRPPVASSVVEATRNNCYSLLHQLLGQESDVNKVHFIKHEDKDLKDLLKRVSTAAAGGDARLKAFAKQDHLLSLEDYQLPPGEQKTRDSISAMEQKEILHGSGDSLEVTLLLTQIEALNYASHLAKVAAEHDTRADRIGYLRGLSAEMKALHDEAVARLSLQPPTPPAR